MRKKKVQSVKNVDQKLDDLATTVDGLVKAVDSLTKTATRTSSTVDGLTQAVSGIIGSLTKMATKDELKSFATKDELKNFATKDDIKDLAAQMVTNERFEDVMTFFKQDFDELKSYVYTKLVTKKEFLNSIHKFKDSLSEMREHRDSRILFQGQHADLQDTVAKHGNRIVVLERKMS